MDDQPVNKGDVARVMGMAETSRTRGRSRCGLFFLVAVLLTTGATALMIREVTQEGREGRQLVADAFALLRTQPILAPPPGATRLLRYEDGPSPMNSGVTVGIVYASPRPAEEVLRWYHDNFRSSYTVSLPPLNPAGEASTVGHSKGNERVLVSVSVGPNVPGSLPGVEEPRAAPPGTKTYIEVQASVVVNFPYLGDILSD